MDRFKRVYIEISNICNLKCSFCPEVERSKQVMSVSDFTRIAAEVKPFTDEVCLHLMGEPLNHPQFDEVVAVCEQLHIPVQITTNGVLLTEAKKLALLSSTIRQVNFSVHSFMANFGDRDAGSYLRKIFNYTRKAMVQRPDQYINYRLWDIEAKENSDRSFNQDISEQDSVRLYIEKEFDFSFADLKLNLRRKKGYRITGRLYVHFDSRFEWPSLAAPKYSERGTCHGLRSHIGIHANGSVVPCCLDKEAVINLGNLHQQNLASILAQPKAKAIKEGFEAGKLVEKLCQHCQYIRRFD